MRAFYVPRDDQQARVFIGQDSIMSRWNMGPCANCQVHLLRNVSIDLAQVGDLDNVERFEVEIVSKSPLSSEPVVVAVSVDNSQIQVV